MEYIARTIGTDEGHLERRDLGVSEIYAHRELSKHAALGQHDLSGVNATLIVTRDDNRAGRAHPTREQVSQGEISATAGARLTL